MSIPIPRFEIIKVKPINFAKCAKTLDGNDKDDRYLIMADTKASKAVKDWCAGAIPYIEYLQQQEKYYIEKVHELLCDDLHSAFPELKLTSVPLRTHRNRRGIGTLILTAIPGLITLAIKSVSSWIKGKQQRRVLYMWLTKYLDHCLGTMGIKTVDVVQCTFSFIIMNTMYQYG